MTEPMKNQCRTLADIFAIKTETFQSASMDLFFFFFIETFHVFD